MISNAWYTFCRRLCKGFCLLWFRMHIEGLENIPQKGGFLLVSNHQSFLDPLFCCVFITRPMHFFARDSLFKNPVFGRLIHSVNAIPVRRGQADLGAIKQVLKRLKAEQGVLLYPEGTRTSDGKIAELKPGFGLLCRKSGVPVVPMVIDGAFEAWPRHQKLFSSFKPIHVRYGTIITSDEIRQINDQQLALRLTQTLRRMQNQIRMANDKRPIDYDGKNAPASKEGGSTR